MEGQTLINVIAGGAIAVIGWFARQIWEAVQKLQQDIHEVEVDLPKTYVNKREFADSLKSIESMFQRIYDKLEAKLDKSDK